MALLYIKQVENSSLLGMWEMDAEIENLAISNETNLPPELKSLKRKKELVSTRLLMDAMYPGAQIKYLSSGKPYIADNACNISISHSKDRVCILLNATQRVGIDIQYSSPKITRLKEKFLNDNELLTITDATQIDALHFYWCAKEAMYKFFGEATIDFRKHLAINHFRISEHGSLQGTIYHQSEKVEITLHYEKTSDYYLVYTATSQQLGN